MRKTHVGAQQVNTSLVQYTQSLVFCLNISVIISTNTQLMFTCGVNVGTRLLPLLWASSCDAELTATLQSEQYRRRRAFSSSVSLSVSASGSASGSRSGSEGEFSFDCLSSPPAAEVVSGAVAAVLFRTIGEATGTGVGIVGVAKGCAGLSTGDSGRGAAPGMPSVERNTWFILNIWLHPSFWGKHVLFV